MKAARKPGIRPASLYRIKKRHTPERLMKRAFLSPILVALLCLSPISAQTTAPPMNLYNDDKIRLVVRADDFGFSHASNMALEKLLNEGTLTAASVIVNTGWLDE